MEASSSADFFSLRSAPEESAAIWAELSSILFGSHDASSEV